jgi:hypothetical protein
MCIARLFMEVCGPAAYVLYRKRKSFVKGSDDSVLHLENLVFGLLTKSKDMIFPRRRKFGIKGANLY